MSYKQSRQYWRWSFFFIITILVCSGIFASFQINKFFVTADKVEATHQIVETVGSLLSRLKDAETGQRGYLLTGDKEYLIPYEQSLQTIQLRIEKLLLLSENDSKLRDTTIKIKELTEKRLEIIKQTISDFKENPQAALDVVRSGEGKQLMDEIRTLGETITVQKRSILNTRSDQQDSAQQLSHLFLSIIIIATISLAILAYVINSQFYQRHQELISEIAEKNAAKSEAEKAVQLKDEFVATLSHELRSPLNAIVGWTQILKKSSDPESLKKGLDIIDRNSKLQVKMITDLLDMSRIVSGKLKLDIRKIDLEDLIETAVNSIKPLADTKDIEFIKSIDFCGFIQVDATRVQQVILNILSNAIKFTPSQGKVYISAAKVDDHLVISIRDTGQGISPEFITHVFERFRQGDGSITRRHGGLGLGLSIAKNLIEMHGGTITAHSEGENKGATFTINLPPSVFPLSAQEPASEESLNNNRYQNLNLGGIKILALDDEEDARDLVQRILKDHGADVVPAKSSREALQLLNNGLVPDAIVSDIGMPDQDGFEFIKSVRLLGAEKVGIPAIALTALARAEDKKKALDSGFQTHVSKPVDPTELVSLIANLVAARK